MEVGIRLKIWELRNEKGMEIIELSERTGISANTIYNYESGRNLPGLNNLVIIAVALDVTLDELVFYSVGNN